MRAFHGKQEVKDLYLNRVRDHRAADELVKGQYWSRGKGCAVGCTIHGNSHAAYETELGIPRALARLEDYLFERLPNHLAMEWPEKFLLAIKPGAELSLVGSRFLHWLLVDPADGVIRFADSDQDRAAIQGVADLYGRRLKGEEPAESEWKDAKDAAYAASVRAANAANAAAAYYAIPNAANVAVNVANAVDAVDGVNAVVASAHSASAASSTVHADYIVICVRQSEKLIELLEAAN